MTTDSQATKPARSRKYVAYIFLVIMLLAMVPIIWRGFIPTPHWRLVAACIAGAITLSSSFLLFKLFKSGQWQLAGPWLTYGPVKKALMAPLCILFVFGIVWIDIAASLPMAYTTAFGQEVTRPAMVEKKRSSGRSCHHQLKIENIDYLFFEFCIDSDGFDDLPNQPMSALVGSRQSYFGEAVNSIRLAVPR